MPEDCATLEDVLRAKGVEVDGVFDIHRALETFAMFFSQEYNANITLESMRPKTPEEMEEMRKRRAQKREVKENEKKRSNRSNEGTGSRNQRCAI